MKLYNGTDISCLVFVRLNVWRSLWKQCGSVGGRPRVTKLCRRSRGRRRAGYTAANDGRCRTQHLSFIGRRRVRAARLFSPPQPGRHVAKLVSAGFAASVQQQCGGNSIDIINNNCDEV